VVSDGQKSPLGYSLTESNLSQEYSSHNSFYEPFNKLKDSSSTGNNELTL